MAETVTLQRDRKVDLNCKMENADCEGAQGVLEPLERFQERFPAAVPSTVSCVNQGVIPVRFYNYSDEPVVIYKGTNVGDFCPLVGRGEVYSTSRCYRVEIDPYYQDGGPQYVTC